LPRKRFSAKTDVAFPMYEYCTVQIKTAYLYCTRTVRIAKRCTTVVRVRVAQEMHAQLHTCHVNYDIVVILYYFRSYESTFVQLLYGSTFVLPYESSSCSVYVLCSTVPNEGTKVARYVVLPYTCTSYMYVHCTFESTKVLSKIEYFRKYLRTFVVRTAVHVGLHVYSCTRTLTLLMYSDK
jgi:hypothetical protein